MKERTPSLWSVVASQVPDCIFMRNVRFAKRRVGREKGELLVRFELLSVRLARNHHRDTINTEAVLEWIFGDWNE